MGKHNDFDQKGKIGHLGGSRYQEKFTAPTSRLGDVYFTWDMVSDAVRYTKLTDKLKEYITVHFWYHATMAVSVGA